MDTVYYMKRKLHAQQSWVRLSCYGVIGLTALLLFLSFFGTESANIRSSGMMAFTDQESTTSLLGRQVSFLLSRIHVIKGNAVSSS
jgi:hypothetical protein